MLRIIVSLAALIMSMSAQAFNVDKMIIISDDKENGIATLFNDEPHSLFVQAQVDEIQIVDGSRIERTPYTRENLNDWKVTMTHQKLVLKPGEEKDVGIRSLCKTTNCERSEDLMFLLSFSPAKYREAGEELDGVEINYGFAPVYIIPTVIPKYDYQLFNNGNSLRIENNSNTMIKVFVDTCNDENTNGCKKKFTVFAGQYKTFTLTDSMQSNELNVTVTSHDNSYSKKEKVVRGKI